MYLCCRDSVLCSDGSGISFVVVAGAAEQAGGGRAEQGGAGAVPGARGAAGGFALQPPAALARAAPAPVPSGAGR